MHEIYEDKGILDFETQLPIIFYSSIISMILSITIQKLGHSDDAISDFKQNNEITNINEAAEKLIYKLKIKYVFYFITSFILLIFFWYYISMFNAVYRNTQIHLLKDTIMGFGLSFVYPFIINLLPGLFRLPALNTPKKIKSIYITLVKFLI